MKRFVLIAACLIVASCNFGCATWNAMSDSEKAMVVVGLVSTTAIISSNSNGDTLIREQVCQQHGNQGCDN